MKNNNTNTNKGIMMNEESIKAIVAQAMAQGIKAGMAQAMQAQAMGAGDAGKPLSVSLPNKAQAQAQGKGKAQAGKANKAQAMQAQGDAIEYIPCKRSEEKALVGMVRDALIAGNEGDCLSLIKAWHVMVNKNKTVSNDTIIALYRNLCKVAFDGKYATVKGTKDACLLCKSCGRIKAWLYTFNRGDVKIIG